MSQSLILLGDLELPRRIDIELPVELHDFVWWIPGNHDFDRLELSRNLYESSMASRNLHLRVAMIDGHCVAGLGGIFKRTRVWDGEGGPTMKKAVYERLLRKDGHALWRSQEIIFQEDVEEMRKFGADILVCHEAPSCHRHGFAAIDRLAIALGAKTIYHGHHHESYRSSIHNGKITVVGVGKGEVVDLDGNVLRQARPDVVSCVDPQSGA